MTPSRQQPKPRWTTPEDEFLLKLLEGYDPATTLGPYGQAVCLAFQKVYTSHTQKGVMARIRRLTDERRTEAERRDGTNRWTKFHGRVPEVDELLKDAGYIIGPDGMARPDEKQPAPVEQQPIHQPEQPGQGYKMAEVARVSSGQLQPPQKSPALPTPVKPNHRLGLPLHGIFEATISGMRDRGVFVSIMHEGQEYAGFMPMEEMWGEGRIFVPEHHLSIGDRVMVSYLGRHVTGNKFSCMKAGFLVPPLRGGAVLPPAPLPPGPVPLVAPEPPKQAKPEPTEQPTPRPATVTPKQPHRDSNPLPIPLPPNEAAAIAGLTGLDRVIKLYSMRLAPPTQGEREGLAQNYARLERLGLPAEEWLFDAIIDTSNKNVESKRSFGWLNGKLRGWLRYGKWNHGYPELDQQVDFFEEETKIDASRGAVEVIVGLAAKYGPFNLTRGVAKFLGEESVDVSLVFAQALEGYMKKRFAPVGSENH